MGGTEGYETETAKAKGRTVKTETNNIRSVSRDPVGRARRNLQNLLEGCGPLLVARSIQLCEKNDDTKRTLSSSKHHQPPSTTNLTRIIGRRALRYHSDGHLAPRHNNKTGLENGDGKGKISGQGHTKIYLHYNRFRNGTTSKIDRRRNGSTYGVHSNIRTQRATQIDIDRLGQRIQRRALLQFCERLGISYYVCPPEEHVSILCKRVHRYLNKVQRIEGANAQTFEHCIMNTAMVTYA
jgi:hypothetical protein